MMIMISFTPKTNKKQGGSMKRALVFLFLLCFMAAGFGICFAKIKKYPTGKVENQTFVDNLFGFRISAIDNWKVSSEKETQTEPSLVRAIIYKVNYEKKRESRFSAYESTRPTVIITADTTSLEIEDYEKAFLGHESKLDRKKKDAYVLKLDMLDNSELASSTEIEVDSIKGKRIALKKRYSKQVGDETSVSPMEVEGDRYTTGVKAPSKVSVVEDYITGFVLLLKNENVIYVIQFSCEAEFLRINNEDLIKIVRTWKF